MTPTPTPVPPPSNPDSMAFYFYNNGVVFIAAAWAVVILFIFESLVFDRVKIQNGFLIIAVVCLPAVIVQPVWYALSVYMWNAIWLMITGVRMIFGKKV